MNMNAGYLLGVDIGTTTSKGVIVTLQGKQVASCSFEHSVDYLHPGWAEHDAEKVWWGDFVSICKTLLKEASIDPHRILAVGCSAMSPAVLPMDNAGRPLRKGILYSMDTRTVEEIEILRSSLGDKYSIDTSTSPFSSQTVLPKILWIKRHEPEIFKKAARFLYVTSYLVYKLTNNYVVDHDAASSGGLPYNFHTMGWDSIACKEIGINPDQMPLLAFPQESAGKLTAKAAAETGLPEGIHVAVGTVDGSAQDISMGIVKKGSAVIHYGTSLGLNVYIDREMYIPGLRLFRSAMFKNLYFIGGSLSTGAGLTKWFKNNFGQMELETERLTGVNAYHDLSSSASTVKPGSEGLVVLPYFSGERYPFVDPKARGVIFGLTLRHTKAHIYRALLEGAAYGIRHVLDVLKGGDINPDTVVMTGGGTSSDVWTQIMSDVTRLEQWLPAAAGKSEYGSAYLGGLAAGVLDLSFLYKIKDSYEKIVKPNPANKEIYDKYYQIYRSLYSKTVDEMHLLE